MLARIVIAWVLFTPVSYAAVLKLGGGAVVVMFCMVGYMVLIAAAMAFRFNTGRWRTIELIEPKLVDA
jgi:hypothetical protein